ATLSWLGYLPRSTTMSSDQNPSIISHLSIGTNDFARARAFYDKVLPSLGIGVVMEHPDAVAYGKAYPEFWVQVPINGKPASVGNGLPIGIIAINKDQELVIYYEASAAGVYCDGAPGLRPLYDDHYYGCFVRDLDGLKIEAAF